jgi:hypothetical protein
MARIVNGYEIRPMGNFERARLKGVINEFGEKNDIDLRGADLRHADFNFSYLQDVDLRGAKLRGAIFAYAIFEENVNLGGADLRGAIFRDADLRGANLEGADLRGADLRRAKIPIEALRTAYVDRTTKGLPQEIIQNFVDQDNFSDLSQEIREEEENLREDQPATIKGTLFSNPSISSNINTFLAPRKNGGRRKTRRSRRSRRTRRARRSRRTRRSRRSRRRS